jgi:hypothetical protein
MTDERRLESMTDDSASHTPAPATGADAGGSAERDEPPRQLRVGSPLTWSLSYDLPPPRP